jgi:hypothetical protein
MYKIEHNINHFGKILVAIAIAIGSLYEPTGISKKPS